MFKFGVSGTTSQKIETIKLIRLALGVGLKEAKDMMDDIVNYHNTQEFEFATEAEYKEYKEKFLALGLTVDNVVDEVMETMENLLRDALDIAVANRKDSVASGILNLIQTHFV